MEIGPMFPLEETLLFPNPPPKVNLPIAGLLNTVVAVVLIVTAFPLPLT